MNKELIDATILLRCAAAPHDCESLRDALVKLDGITEAYMTNTQLQNVKYCVGGTIVTTHARIEKLRQDVLALKKSNKRLHVDRVAMLIGA